MTARVARACRCRVGRQESRDTLRTMRRSRYVWFSAICLSLVAGFVSEWYRAVAITNASERSTHYIDSQTARGEAPDRVVLAELTIGIRRASRTWGVTAKLMSAAFVVCTFGFLRSLIRSVRPSPRSPPPLREWYVSVVLLVATHLCLIGSGVHRDVWLDQSERIAARGGTDRSAMLAAGLASRKAALVSDSWLSTGQYLLYAAFGFIAISAWRSVSWKQREAALSNKEAAEGSRDSVPSEP